MVKNKKKGKKTDSKLFKVLLTTIIFLILCPISIYAAGTVDINVNGGGIDTVQIILMLTVLGLLPSILIMMTCYTRIIIVLSFLRNALGLQQTPPNQVLIGLALFLSLFIMSPVISEINTEAYEPYKAEEITQEEFLSTAAIPVKQFMLKQTKPSDLDLFIRLSNTEQPEEVEELSLVVIIPAFITSELKRAFSMGFLIFIPFLIIDMIVSSTLMSMGMIMLPPVMISLPFKLLLFVLVDGWGLLFKTLAVSFEM